ncbi:DUF1364 domain-containing protein [uncultured Marinobacter sp.]|uniref:DUF1364 domain-containing protein n=1 Tax=uncultured Marinobacter sp. TaxID=187379 RepID=UPI0025863B1B|nr:DUF1364 domain-containing protein [uncultured Marinobacter sp.]
MALQRKTPLKSRTGLKTKTPLKTKAPMKRAAMKSVSKSKASPIRQSAKGQPCLVRIPGVCNGDPSTVVLAHLNGAGIGTKAGDHEGAYACSACHAWLDGGYATEGYFKDTRELWHLQGILRTQRALIDKGFIVIKGAA